MLNDNKSIFGNFSKDLLRINFQISKSFRQFHLPPPLFGQRSNCNCSRSLSTLLLLASHLPTIHGRQCTFLSRVNLSYLLGNDFLFLKSFFHRSKHLANHLWFPSPMVTTSQASVQISTVLLTYHPFFLCLNFFKYCFTSHHSSYSTSTSSSTIRLPAHPMTSHSPAGT